MNETVPRDTVSPEDVDVRSFDDRDLHGHMELEEELEAGEIVSAAHLSELCDCFLEEFGEKAVPVLSIIEGDGDEDLPLVALRPLNGDGTEAVVLATKVRA